MTWAYYRVLYSFHDSNYQLQLFVSALILSYFVLS